MGQVCKHIKHAIPRPAKPSLPSKQRLTRHSAAASEEGSAGPMFLFTLSKNKQTNKLHCSLKLSKLKQRLLCPDRIYN